MYAKIFCQIYDSSIVENPETRFTFMDLLVLSDANGIVDMTHEAIARRTNRPLDLIRKTILELESPDPRSRTPDADGKRLKRLDEHRDWGWLIVNYDSFRKISSEEQRREKTAARVKKYRSKIRPNAECNAPVTPCNAHVTDANACNAMQRQRQRQKDIKKEVASLPRFQKPSIEEIKLQAAKIALSDIEAEKFFNYYESNGWRVGKNPMKSWTHALTNWKNNAQNYGTNNQNGSRVSEKRIDRSIGTLNEGVASRYAGITGRDAMGKLVKDQNPQRPTDCKDGQ